MFDLVITGGTVIDGSGDAAIRRDVGVVGQMIEAVDDLTGAQASQVIDARGLAVCPGFIDPHTHSETILLDDPQHALGLRQGITTEIFGLDGMSIAPLSAGNYRLYRRYLAGLLGKPNGNLDVSSITALRGHYHNKVAVNTAYLVPLGAVRLETVGFHDVPLTGDVMARAKRIIRDGIAQGAVGFSTGAAYFPGMWSATDELIELCTAVRQAGGVYVCEPRLVLLDRAHENNGVADALHIARQSGVRLHFAHHRTGGENTGNVARFIEPVDRAKAAGVDCTLDIYPYPCGSSIAVAFLPSAAQEGGADAVLARLKDSDHCQKIVDYIDHGHFAPLDEFVFSNVAGQAHLEGMRLSEVARKRGATLGQTICDILLESDLQVGYLNAGPQSAAVRQSVDRDAMELLARPDYMGCSDITPLGSMPHSRCYGAFARIVGRLHRQFNTVGLEQLIQRLTDNPARRFGLTRRGRVQKGYFADIVVFDPQRVIDTATFDDPKQYPLGIPYVLVNGQVAVDPQGCTGALAGQAVPAT